MSFAVFLLACCVGQIEVVKPHPSAEACAAKVKAFRVAAADLQIKRLTELLEEITDSGSPDAKKLARDVQKSIANAKDARVSEVLTVPLLPEDDIRVGQLGVLFDSVKVLQVVGPDSVLCSAPSVFLLKGIDTTTIVDNQSLDLDDILFAYGTFTYTSVAGASKKVPAVEKWKHAAAYAAVIEAAKKKEADRIAKLPNAAEEARLKAQKERERELQFEELVEQAKWRKWNVDGKEVEGKYNGVNSGQVKLLLKDGKSKKIALDKCTKDERDWLKDKPWTKVRLEPEKKPSPTKAK